MHEFFNATAHTSVSFSDSTVILQLRVSTLFLWDPLSPTLTRAGVALQAPPLARRRFRFRLPLSIAAGWGAGRRGWHLAACAPAIAGAGRVRATQWPAEGEGSTSSNAGALSHGGAVGRQDPYWAGRSSSAELAPPPSQQQVSRHAAQRRAERQPKASPALAGGQPPWLP